MSETDIILSQVEIRALTGGLELPRCQVKRLREHGFFRARLERGKAVLERAHYEAICRGQQLIADGPHKSDTGRPRPQLRRVK